MSVVSVIFEDTTNESAPFPFGKEGDCQVLGYLMTEPGYFSVAK